MGVDVSEQREQQEAEATKPVRKSREQNGAAIAPAPPAGRLAQLSYELQTGIGQLQWRDVLLFGILAGALMSLSFLQGSTLSIIAGIVPVGTGLLLGRRIKSHYALHGFMTGLIGGLVGSIVLAVLIFLTPLGATMQSGLGAAATSFTLLNVWAQLAGFTAFSLIAFCTFGTSMAARTEERNRKMREEVDTRGGKLEKPGVIRTADDIRGLSLPQLGTYISNLFKKNGFKFKDYRFIDKDKHLDLWMEHEDEIWHLRLSVADKVSVGTIESLNQDMKREGCRKGVVITSTEFMPTAAKSAKGRPIVLIDGPTLYQIAETK
jgi:membrane protein implicated in regulation of membrane protease activity